MSRRKQILLYALPLLLMPLLCPFTTFLFPQYGTCPTTLMLMSPSQSPAFVANTKDEKSFDPLRKQSVPEWIDELRSNLSRRESEIDRINTMDLPYEPIKAAGFLEFHRIPFRKNGIAAYQSSSRSLRADAPSRDFGGYITVQKELLTIFETYGSGCVQRILIGYPEHYDQEKHPSWKLRVNVDGKVVMSMPLRFVGRGQQKPFIFPISGPAGQKKGLFLNVPIFFKKSCILTIQTVGYDPDRDPNSRDSGGHGLYTVVTYHRYSMLLDTTKQDTFQGEQEDTSEILAFTSAHYVDRYSERPSKLVNLTTHRILKADGSPPLRTGANTLLSYEGAGAIVALYLQFKNADEDHYKSLMIEIVFDGRQDKKIQSPIGLLFGSHDGSYDMESLAVGFKKQSGGYILFPMPFWKEFTITIVVPVEFAGALLPAYFVEVHLSDALYPPRSAGYFGAQVQEKARFFEEPLYDLLNLKDCWGHFVGSMLFVQGLSAQSSQENGMDGDELIYVDDSMSPQMSGVSTKAFYNYIVLQGAASQISSPFHGNQLLNTQPNNVNSATYRLHLADYIPFRKNIRISLENGDHRRSSSSLKYQSVAFYYSSPRPGIRLSDRLDLSSEKDLLSHDYKFQGDPELQQKINIQQAVYDQSYSPKNCMGYSYQGGIIRFFITIDPQNTAILLRRTLDYSSQNQKANVFADGQLAATWYTPQHASKGSIVQDEIWIDGRFSKGKSRLNIEIHPFFNRPGDQEGQSDRWTEIDYEIFSEVS